MIVDAVIEMPENSTYKYEIDKSTGDLRLDRTLGIQVPFNYGYVPNTHCADGDPLDIFVASSHPILAKAHVKAKIIGVFRCIDNGAEYDKLVAVLVGEDQNAQDLETKNGIKNLVEYYLKTYKQGFQVIDYDDEIEAAAVLRKSQELFQADI